MTDQDMKTIIEQQPFAPLILFAIDLAAWLKSTPDTDIQDAIAA